MALTSSRIKYLLTSTRKLVRRQGLACPSCGSSDSTVVSRKYVVTALRRCNACCLLFRSPTTTAEENRAFYQNEYSEGFTTDMPSPHELEQLKKLKFKGSEKDYSHYLSVLTALGCKPGNLLIDYGCSWGYGSWQFMQSGYNVTAFEISTPRCEYARTYLGVNAHANIENAQGPFDIFFSSHVLEHMPSVSSCLELARNVVKPGGWFISFTPNGSQAFKVRYPKNWKQAWGLVHPNYLDDKFYSEAFKLDSYLLASSPYDLESIRQWGASAQQEPLSLYLGGDELLVIARL